MERSDAQSPPCMHCGGNQFDTVLENVRDRVWWKPGAFQLQQCQACGLVQTRPRPHGTALDFYYEDTYDTPEARAGLQRFYEGRLGRLLNQYRLITIEKVRPVTAADHVVDVGCSYGHFLQAVRQARQVSTTGLDLDATSLAHAVDADCGTFRQSTLLDAELADESVTIITFLECLEHDPDPVATLTAARNALVPGGLVAIELPMWNSLWCRVFGRFWHPLFVPQHLVHFSRESLQEVASAAGLEPVHHQTMLFPSELTLSARALVLEWLLGPGRPPSPLLDRVLAPIWILVFWILDVPSQFLLRIAGQAGHQTLIARRPFT
ncbi:MAG: hypothetical protein CL927_07885 [Deltaproteobacteria bacterium]|nr:hypothetical protein [Deltaproteobacteria bacterium]HCH66868.1 hypothetical protein [Deltaproteobacteria bacterium]